MGGTSSCQGTVEPLIRSFLSKTGLILSRSQSSSFPPGHLDSDREASFLDFSWSPEVLISKTLLRDDACLFYIPRCFAKSRGSRFSPFHLSLPGLFSVYFPILGKNTDLGGVNRVSLPPRQFWEYLCCLYSLAAPS